MLFLLTGDVQIGKTRWLERLVAESAANGVTSCGVLAPGVWQPQVEGGFEKRGIDNVLLPEGERVSFARRRDLALADGSYDADSQSARAQLAWEISDEAIARVNAHFAGIAALSADRIHNIRPSVRTNVSRETFVEGAEGAPGGARATSATGSSGAPGGARATSAVSGLGVSGLLVVDELGQLELLRGGGLTEAVALLDEGVSTRFPHALVVVREWLLDRVRNRFSDLWGGCEVLSPDDSARSVVLCAFGLASLNDNEYH